MAKSKEQRDWDAEHDARSLAEAKTIEADKGRMSRAAKAGKRLKADLDKQAKAMAAIAKKAPVKKAAKKK